MVGETLAHYEILDKPVLPDSVSHNPEKLARFEREAKLLASLNHPNIATLHGLEEYDGQAALGSAMVQLTLARM